MALMGSALLGVVTSLALLIYYGIQTAWYWSLILVLVSVIVVGILGGLTDVIFSPLFSALAAFALWPACAIWFYISVRGLTAS
jgi:hypothetical protein